MSYDPPLYWPDISTMTEKQLGALGSDTNFLLWYSSNRRYDLEVGGITVNGVSISTDRDTQSKLTGAAVMSQVNPQFTTQWKLDDGTFVPLDATTMLSIASEVAVHVANCFNTEQQLSVEINANKIKSVDVINAAYNAT